MKYLTYVAAAAAALSGAASAQESIYAQFSAGVSVNANVRTPDIDIDDGVDQFSGFVRLNGEPNFAAGVEFGVDGLARRFRTGISYDYASASVDSADIVGTLNGAPYNETINLDDFDVDNLDLVAEVHFVQGQIAANIAPRTAMFDAYIGGGVGAAFAGGVDKGLAYSGTASVEFPISNDWAGGLRYRYMRASNLTDDVYGFDYEPVNMHLLSVSITGRNK